jgi:hypothetical protein
MRSTSTSDRAPLAAAARAGAAPTATLWTSTPVGSGATSGADRLLSSISST